MNKFSSIHYLEIGNEDTAMVALKKRDIKSIPTPKVWNKYDLSLETPIYDTDGHSVLDCFQVKGLAHKTTPLSEDLFKPIAFIQEEVYSDTYYIEPLDDMVNTMGACLVVTKKFGTNLSLLAYDKDGLPAGYLLAYQARSLCDYRRGDSVVYVHDLAVRPHLQGQGIARNLIVSFLTQWKETKIDTVLADLRKETSYPMLKHYANKNTIILDEIEDYGMVRVAMYL